MSCLVSEYMKFRRTLKLRALANLKFLLTFLSILNLSVAGIITWYKQAKARNNCQSVEFEIR